MEQSELQRTARLVEMNRERFHEVQERIEQVINVLGEHDVTAVSYTHLRAHETLLDLVCRLLLLTEIQFRPQPWMVQVESVLLLLL